MTIINPTDHGTRRTNRGTVERERKIQTKEEKRRVRRLPAMDIEVIYEPSAVIVGLYKQDEEHILRFRPTGTAISEPSSLEPYTLRDTFLKVKTPGEAVELFSVAGFFQDFRDTLDEEPSGSP
jgi:hypothetical protein